MPGCTLKTEFRPATAKDTDLLLNLATTIWNLHFPGIISQKQINYMLNEMYTAPAIKREIAAGVKWQIIYYNEQPAGYFSYSMMCADICKLHKIYVHPSYHGMGIGRKAFSMVREYARENRAKKIVLNVHRNNKKAIFAYMRFGFKIENEENTCFGPFMLNDFQMEFFL
ncbi:MAG: GNAT family N-acetyltransferase [Spirochaetales bacterium]|nr:GNAT family N-acetyltransferase [Spirochaetales bacterium]